MTEESTTPDLVARLRRINEAANRGDLGEALCFAAEERG
jgi:hypothetical protein